MNRSEAEEQLQNLQAVLNVSRYPDEALPVIKGALGKAWDDLAAAGD